MIFPSAWILTEYIRASSGEGWYRRWSCSGVSERGETIHWMYSQTALLCAAAHAFGLAGSQRCPHELQSAAEPEFRLQESQVSGDQSLWLLSTKYAFIVLIMFYSGWILLNMIKQISFNIFRWLLWDHLHISLSMIWFSSGCRAHDLIKPLSYKQSDAFFVPDLEVFRWEIPNLCNIWVSM